MIVSSVTYEKVKPGKYKVKFSGRSTNKKVNSTIRTSTIKTSNIGRFDAEKKILYVPSKLPEQGLFIPYEGSVSTLKQILKAYLEIVAKKHKIPDNIVHLDNINTYILENE